MEVGTRILHGALASRVINRLLDSGKPNLHRPEPNKMPRHWKAASHSRAVRPLSQAFEMNQEIEPPGCVRRLVLPSPGSRSARKEVQHSDTSSCRTG